MHEDDLAGGMQKASFEKSCECETYSATNASVWLGDSFFQPAGEIVSGWWLLWLGDLQRFTARCGFNERCPLKMFTIPIGLYGVFTYIWLICMVNVGKYTIHIHTLILWYITITIAYKSPVLHRWWNGERLTYISWPWLWYKVTKVTSQAIF